jgi:hypothetical protein
LRGPAAVRQRDGIEALVFFGGVFQHDDSLNIQGSKKVDDFRIDFLSLGSRRCDVAAKGA